MKKNLLKIAALVVACSFFSVHAFAGNGTATKTATQTQTKAQTKVQSKDKVQTRVKSCQ